MLMNSICLCRVFILFPLSRLPAYNLGLTFGTRLRTGTKRHHFRSLVHRLARRLFSLFLPISYPESSGLLVSGATQGSR